MEKVGHNYKREKPNFKPDVIIIGSGIGALTAAAALTKEAGKKVLILEQHYTAGGFTHVFKRKDYEWDVGIHYIGEVHNPKSALARICSYISNGKMMWAEMPHVYDRIVIADKTYDFPAGKDNLIAALKGYFPNDHAAIDKYFEAVMSFTKTVGPYFMEKVLPPFVKFFIGNKLKKPFLKWSDRTTKEVLDEITDNQELKAVLTAQFGDYGLAPAESSWAIHATVAKHYFRGGAYPLGGSSIIAATVEKVIEAGGGAIYTGASVKEILIKDGRAYGVKMDDDNVFEAPIIISNAGAQITFQDLVPDSYSGKQGLLNNLGKIEPSLSHVSLYIGLKHTAKELGIHGANYWVYPNNDYDKTISEYAKNPDAELPVAYISFPSAKNPAFEAEYPGKATVEIVSFAPWAWFEKWDGTRWHHRGEEYEAMKEKLTQRLLFVLYKHAPQLEGKIDFMELSSPLSTKHFSRYKQGEIYGLTHTPKRFRQDWLKPQTPIKGLYLSGQDVVTVGFGGAMMGGLLAAAAILKKNIMKNVMKAEGTVAVPFVEKEEELVA